MFKSFVSQAPGRLAALAAILLVAQLALHAQLPTATILGSVKDESGAVIPGASITARNTDNGLTRTTTAANDGSYRLPAPPVGSYEVRGENPGFRAELISGLKLAVSQEAVVNLALKVGSVEESVTVAAEAPLVNTTSGALGSLVNEQKVADLPLNGRNYMDLTLLQPGIVRNTRLTPNSTSTIGVYFSSNGAPVRSNNYMLDGALLTNQTGATAASADGSTLGISAIREYKVVTSSVSAEYGMTMGGQITMVSKSGTNQNHFELFEFLRNSVLDARNFFDYKSGASQRRLPAYTRNQFGGTAGGPIKQDQAFYLVSFEALRERLGITIIDNVFGSGCHAGGGSTITNAQCPQLGATAASVTVTPQIAPLLDLFPKPNLPNNQYTFPFSQPTSEDYVLGRYDHNFSSNDTIYARYAVDDTQQTNPVAYEQFKFLRNSRAQHAVASQIHIFSPALLNTVRFSFSRNNALTGSLNPFSGPQYSFVPGRPMGAIVIAGLTSMSPSTPSQQLRTVLTWSDDMFHTLGRHSLKFGTLINHYTDTNFTATNINGTMNFPSVASFFTAQPTSYNSITPGSNLNKTYKFVTFGFYLQDDFRPLPTLTLNLGVRYEAHTVPREVDGNSAALRDVQNDSATTVGPIFKNMSLKNFSPRFGFAWDIGGQGRMALRGGFAELFDIAVFGQTLNIATTGTPPFSSNSAFTAPAGQPVPVVTLPFPFTAGNVGRSLRTQDYHMAQPHLLAYNLSFERQLPGQTAISVAYVGSRGLNLMKTVEGNPTVSQIQADGRQFFPVGAPRVNRNWTSMEFKTAGGDSWYNSLQASFNKALTHGFQLQTSYTWSKLIDETQGQALGENTAASLFGADPLNHKTDRAVADFDLTQSLRINTIYDLPKLDVGGLRGKLLSGWRVSSILSLQDGLPSSIVLANNNSRSGVNNAGPGIDRPDLVAGRTKSDVILGQPQRYYDPSAFTLPAAGFLGNVGRNFLRGPGTATLDLSLVKNTPVSALGEQGRVEFRAEMFNILNRVNFADPNRTVFSGTQGSTPLLTAGTITSTATTARQIQLSLKLFF